MLSRRLAVNKSMSNFSIPKAICELLFAVPDDVGLQRLSCWRIR